MTHAHDSRFGLGSLFVLLATAGCLGGPIEGDEDVDFTEEEIASSASPTTAVPAPPPCYSTFTPGDCTDVYITWCGGVAMCETHVQKCLPGGPCITEQSGPNCAAYAPNLQLPWCVAGPGNGNET